MIVEVGYSILLWFILHYRVNLSQIFYIPCPLNSFKLIFQPNLCKTLKKLHTFFLLCMLSILNLLYLYNFGSPRSEIATYSIPVHPLSNATSLIEIVFSKKQLCPISQDDLLIYFFHRANLYEVPRVTVSTFRPENNKKKSTIHPLSVASDEISI